MAITEHTPRDVGDDQKLWTLAQTHPDAQRHLTDLPYRLCSPSAMEPENVRLWTDEQGNSIGWAILQWEFWTLDHAVAPGAHRDEVARRILAWAIRRCGVLAAARGEPLRLFVDVREPGPPPALPLDDFGFTLYPHWRQYHLERPAGLAPRPSQIPNGFTIRPLAGADEVDAYVALHRAAFDSENMTSDWRRETLRMPQYTPDLNLVAAAPDGTLAGFCICWLNTMARWETGPEITGQVEPIGVAPAYQGSGLGRALMFEAVRRMAVHGAQRMFVEVDAGNDAARSLYESAGFRVRDTILKYMREVAPAPAGH
ncbi:MAG TPA: GNAT family N-acetyltransferase [Ktedonobacterales bacterium]|nr:GNAT family N-acetyltransferase [Ktedonobacterales bacterium]